MHSSPSRRDFVKSVLATSIAGRVRVPTRSGHKASQAVVIGAGAFGGWTALALLRNGHRVTLVDAWGAGNARASSGGETRVIRGIYNGEGIYTNMAARAMELWRDAERRWQRQVYFPIGSLWMCAGDDSFVRRSIGPMQLAGLPVHELTVAEARRRFPHMGMDDVRTVFLEPQSGYLLARQSCELVRETFVREGGDYRLASVQPMAATSGTMRQLRLSDGTSIDADLFVFACGPWMAQLFPAVIGRRIVATRQEVFFFGTPAGDARYEPGNTPVWVHLGNRLVYGIPGNERRGLKLADDSAGPEVDPTTQDRSPTPGGLANARVFLRARFPELASAPLLESRVCQYEASTDGNYLMDRHPQLENVWLVGGGSGHGFKMGPAIGEHVAALVQGSARPIPLFGYSRLAPRP